MNQSLNGALLYKLTTGCDTWASLSGYERAAWEAAARQLVESVRALVLEKLGEYAPDEPWLPVLPDQRERVERATAEARQRADWRQLYDELTAERDRLGKLLGFQE